MPPKLADYLRNNLAAKSLLLGAYVAMSSARLALSRHVGHNVSRTFNAPLRREVGRWSINDARCLRARWKGNDRSISVRWQSSVGEYIFVLKYNCI